MSDHFTYFIEAEERLIAEEITREHIPGGIEKEPVSKSLAKLINANLSMTDEVSLAFKVHRQLIDSLITYYIISRYRIHYEALEPVFQYVGGLQNIKEDAASFVDDIPILTEELHIAFLNSEFTYEKSGLVRKKSKHHLKERGAVYTVRQICREIVTGTIGKAIEEAHEDDRPVKQLSCLDFGCGTGRFYFEAIEVLQEEYSMPMEQIVCDNLYALDLDDVALSILRCKLISQFPELNAKIISALQSNIIKRNALIPSSTLIPETEHGLDRSADFNTVFKRGGFDVIFSNPPYNLLKVNKKPGKQQSDIHFKNRLKKVQKEINFFRTSGIYHYSIEGMLNYYQLSIEMILQLTRERGSVGIICPSSLFADLTSKKLRKHMFTAHQVHFIRYYPEAARLFENVSQSTVIFFLQKGVRNNKIRIEVPGSRFSIDLALVEKIFPGNFEIPLIDKTGWSVLKKISKQQKIKDIPYLRNKRGELDLTLFRNYITRANTGWRLVRGNMISDEGLTDRNGEYVEAEEFLREKSDDFKINDHGRERLICHQISNIDIRRRLKFVFCKKRDILANSCNYIVSTRNQDDLVKLKYVLNSSLLNWRFKITSSNNHINNYELDELPVVDLDCIDLRAFSEDERRNNEIICKLYGLNGKETDYIMTRFHS